MTTPSILCIGSVLWDVIGRSASVMRQGSDVPGRIVREPGGVAHNIARTLVQFGLEPVLLSAVGRDREGEALLRLCAERGMITDHVFRSDDLPTDQYMAVEGANGLIAAIADAHSLEAEGKKITAPLEDGTLGSAATPFAGWIVLDGNLTHSHLAHISQAPSFARADLRVAPASPGKADRLLPFLQNQRGTLYVNLEEARTLGATPFETASEAAQALVARGACRAIVTNGGAVTADATADGVFSGQPPDVLVTRVTGAGDTFMAAHIASEIAGAARAEALDHALNAAARFVSGDTPL